MNSIKTPDQRVRIFISSTIHELSEERALARKIIEELRMTPVFFESGARPHPPRDLYQAYLEQSDVFVGIYYKSYGWVAPDMSVSGIEDEWLLAKDKPQLIYIKESDARDPALKSLLEKIQQNGAVCYQQFRTSEDIAGLLGNDLALLLTERFFSRSKPADKDEPVSLKSSLPVLRNKTIGRNKEISEIIELISDPDAGLVTLTGAGGTGKTRLSLEVGKRLKNNFQDGVHFVALSSISDYEKLPAVIAQSLDMNKGGTSDLKEWVAKFLSDKNALLLLDNFEQITKARNFLSMLLDNCPELKIIVTSRTPLYINNEIIYEVQPLNNNSLNTGGRNELSDAEQLFIQRAKESNVHIEWNAGNLHAAGEICKKLDGLPLAIELMAARCRHIEPQKLVEKMNSMLDAATGNKDVPERQQTMRNTIEWSYQLLSEEAKRLFRRLSVFANGWSFDAMQKICWDGFGESASLEPLIEQLTDYGLVVNTFNRNAYANYRFLNVIKEFALEKNNESREKETLIRLHYNYFFEFSYTITHKIQSAWAGAFDPNLIRIREANDDIVFAFNNAIEQDNYKVAVSLIVVLSSMYLVTGKIGFLLEMIEKAKLKSDPESIRILSSKLSNSELAQAFFSTGFIRTTIGDLQDGLRDLEFSKACGLKENLTTLNSHTLLFMGVAHLSMGNLSRSKDLLEECIRQSILNNQPSVRITCGAIMGEILSEEGKYEEALKLVSSSLEECRNSNIPFVLSFCLYQKGYLVCALNQYEEALILFSECQKVNEAYDFNFNAAYPLMGISIVECKRGELNNARTHLRSALECYRKSGNNLELICIMYVLILLLNESAEKALSLKYYAHARKLFQTMGFQPWSTFRKSVAEINSFISNHFTKQEVEEAINAAGAIPLEEIIEILEKQ